MVSYQPPVVVSPPTVNITDPLSNPFETSVANITVTAITTNTAHSSEVAVTVNNTNLNFNFDPSTGMVSFNVRLINGNNTVVVTVSNANGTASDNTIIICKKPPVTNPPVLEITTPSVSPISVAEGNYEFVGNVKNLEHVGQLQIY